MSKYYRDDLRWFENNPLRRYRVRLAHEGEAQEYAALYLKTTGVELPLSIYPAYAAVFRLSYGNHARHIFFSGTDHSDAGDAEARRIFQQAARVFQ